MSRKKRRKSIEGQALIVAGVFCLFITISAVESVIQWWGNLNNNTKSMIIFSTILGFVLFIAFLIWKKNFTRQLDSKRRQERIFRIKELSKIKQKTPRDFEYFVADVFKELGFDAQVTKATGDGGKDIVLIKEKTKAIVECKRYNDKKISVNLIRQFHSVIIDTHSDHGYFVTTSDFTKEAKNYVKDKPIKLINGEDLIYLISSVENQNARHSEYLSELKPT
jgi:restriction system protein